MVVNCDFFSRLTINRFAKIILCVFYNTVWSQQAQLLDSQFGPTSLKHTVAVNKKFTFHFIVRSF